MKMGHGIRVPGLTGLECRRHAAAWNLSQPHDLLNRFYMVSIAHGRPLEANPHPNLNPKTLYYNPTQPPWPQAAWAAQRHMAPAAMGRPPGAGISGILQSWVSKKTSFSERHQPSLT